jgi:hypothetical protein
MVTGSTGETWMARRGTSEASRPRAASNAALNCTASARDTPSVDTSIEPA